MKRNPSDRNPSDRNPSDVPPQVPYGDDDDGPALFDRPKTFEVFVYWRRYLSQAGPLDPLNAEHRDGLHALLDTMEEYLLKNMEIIEACADQLTHEELYRLVRELLLLHGKLPGLTLHTPKDTTNTQDTEDTV